MYFYPRSPCGERLGGAHVVGNVQLFLSTLSLRRATFCCAVSTTIIPNFYPRSPCGERPPKHEVCRGGINFYPRSPCGERPVRVVRTCWSPYFYPRSPCGERHGQDVLLPAALEFLSTLSLRRATIGGSTNQTHKINFYPRSPCGERLFGNEAMGAGNNNFYPRSPCGERPVQLHAVGAVMPISIHALLAESDP